jgi:hypothetical protein
MRTAIKAISAAAMLAAFAASAAPAQAASVISAGWTDACGKSNCFDAKGAFTKSWSAADASGPMTIGKLMLARSVLGDLDGQTFRLSFRLNGQELGTWGSYTMGGIQGDELGFQGTDFTWNPEDGDLELVLEIVRPAEGGAGGGFSAFRSSNTETPGEETGGPQGGPQEEQNPPGNGVPQEQEEPFPLPGGRPVAGVVPEPSTWALMIGGFGLAGAAARRKRAVLRMQPCR